MSDQAASAQKASSVYNDLRQMRDFCDGVLVAEGVEFPIHKVIVCKCSPYFRALFTRWSSLDKKVYEIPGLSAAVLDLILDFAYTGCVSVTKGNVQDLMQAADQFNLTEIVQTCCDFLERNLCVENCIGVWHFTDACYSPELHAKAHRYITDHFEDIVYCEEFQYLTAGELCEILGRDDLNVKKERAVFDAVIRWISHAPKRRRRHIAELVSKVRLLLTSPEYIRTNVESNELVWSDPECKSQVQTCLQILEQNFDFISLFNSPLARPRLPNAILLAIGGWSGGDPTNGIEAYDIRADRWINVTNVMERPRAYHGTAFLNGYVYCVGGFDRVEHFNSVRKFDPVTHTWHEAAPMHSRRCYVSVTVLDGLIYAMGGFDGHVRLNTAERYRPETNQWSFIAPMHEQRSDASCTTLHKRVYICGGFNGNECLHTCEYYQPDTRQWTLISPMTIRRSGIGVIAYADQVYAVGGFDGNARLSSVEAYNTLTNSWHPVASMITTRSNFGIEVIDDQLFVIGGFDGFTTSYNVECYDAMTNEWREACDMQIFRSALSCCVVSGLPSMARYVIPRDQLPLLQLQERELERDSA